MATKKRNDLICELILEQTPGEEKNAFFHKQIPNDEYGEAFKSRLGESENAIKISAVKKAITEAFVDDKAKKERCLDYFNTALKKLFKSQTVNDAYSLTPKDGVLTIKDDFALFSETGGSQLLKTIGRKSGLTGRGLTGDHFDQSAFHTRLKSPDGLILCISDPSENVTAFKWKKENSSFTEEKIAGNISRMMVKERKDIAFYKIALADDAGTLTHTIKNKDDTPANRYEMSEVTAESIGKTLAVLVAGGNSRVDISELAKDKVLEVKIQGAPTDKTYLLSERAFACIQALELGLSPVDFNDSPVARVEKTRKTKDLALLENFDTTNDDATGFFSSTDKQAMTELFGALKDKKGLAVISTKQTAIPAP